MICNGRWFFCRGYGLYRHLFLEAIKEEWQFKCEIFSKKNNKILR
jgi:hypothetical protein